MIAQKKDERLYQSDATIVPATIERNRYIITIADPACRTVLSVVD